MGNAVDMNRIKIHKQMNDALGSLMIFESFSTDSETINEMKIGLNDKLLTKALTEGKGKLPFTFDNGTKSYANLF